MRHLPIETLVDGAIRTLREAVLPAVAGRFARGQLFAVLDVLNNLRDRIEPRAELAGAEADSAAAALSEAAAALDVERAAPIVAALAEAPSGPPAARVAALRRGLVVALDVLSGLPDDAAPAARAAVAAHLAAQAMRDVMLLKPSLLEEISKG